MSDAADSMAVALRFAALARKNDPTDYEVVIHAAYYSMHDAARAALLAANGTAPTNHGRVAERASLHWHGATPPHAGSVTAVPSVPPTIYASSRTTVGLNGTSRATLPSSYIS